ncbi:MAG: lysophospholipid acyltransferase family protein [Magnetovibrionaceae bacterium]
MGNGKGRLIVANHPTLIDVVLLVSLMPQAQCIVKHSLWSHRFLGGVMRGAGYIRNDGNPETVLGQCRDAISQGLDIIIFPEGTRSVPGQSIKFQRGFANIATMAPCDIQLVTITCRPPTLAKGSPWYDIPPTRPAFQLTVDEQVDISRYLTNDPRSKIVRRLTRDLERHYSGILTNGQA